MKQYFSFFRIRFTSGLQYRVAAWAGICTQLFWGLMEILMFRAFYRYAPERLPMSMQALSNYVWIQQATLSVWIVTGWDFELFQSIQSGAVAYELIRPSNLYAMWSARSFGSRLSRAALRFAPVLLVGSLLPAPYGLRLTVPASTFGMFLLSLLLPAKCPPADFWRGYCGNGVYFRRRLAAFLVPVHYRAWLLPSSVGAAQCRHCGRVRG